MYLRCVKLFYNLSSSFHDDQHGTAIIMVAGLFNALELTGRQIHNVKVVFAGEGAAGIGCAELLLTAGVPLEHITLCDIHGVVYRGRSEEMDPYKVGGLSHGEANASPFGYCA